MNLELKPMQKKKTKKKKPKTQNICRGNFSNTYFNLLKRK